MSDDIVLTLNRICLRCGDTTAKNVRRILLKTGSDKRLIFYVLCNQCVGATLAEIQFNIEQHPSRWQECTVKDLQDTNPILSDPDYIKFKIA